MRVRGEVGGEWRGVRFGERVWREGVGRGCGERVWGEGVGC